MPRRAKGSRRPRKPDARPALRPRRKRRGPGKTEDTPVEYGILLTATMILFALGAVMVFSASSTRTMMFDLSFNTPASAKR